MVLVVVSGVDVVNDYDGQWCGSQWCWWWWSVVFSGVGGGQ